MQVFLTKYVSHELLDFVTLDTMAVIIIYYKRRKLMRIGSCLLQLMTFSDSPVVIYISCLGLTK